MSCLQLEGSVVKLKMPQLLIRLSVLTLVCLYKLCMIYCYKSYSLFLFSFHLCPNHCPGVVPTFGHSHTLTCNVSGAGVTTHQWRKDGSVIQGETIEMLSFSSLRLSDAGQYTCEVIVEGNRFSNTRSSYHSTKGNKHIMSTS